MGDVQATNLETLLDRLEESCRGKDRITIGVMLEAAGQRSFGALLLLAGLIAISPLSGIPGMPTTISIMVLVTAGQILLGRSHFWVPQWVLRRSVSQAKFERALLFLRPVARSVDRLIRPRLRALTQNSAIYVVSVLAILVALTMPPLELLPFAATTAGAALAIFGLALVAHDGLLVIIAVSFYPTSLVLITKTFL